MMIPDCYFIITISQYRYSKHLKFVIKNAPHQGLVSTISVSPPEVQKIYTKYIPMYTVSIYTSVITDFSFVKNVAFGLRVYKNSNLSVPYIQCNTCRHLLCQQVDMCC